MDYAKLGFKCGIEIHQQLEGKKLFCGCPTIIRKDEPDFTFERRLRASAGESGKVDVAAAHEQKKGKLFSYQGYDDTTCLVEMDEEPPGPLNQDALKITLLVSSMLNCQIVDKIQVMRKTVVDGSNVSGFQRTVLVGMDGFIEMNGKKIGVSSVCLEEEACQVMKRTKDHDVYNLSRLGIPLLEIATEPDITSPEECRDAAAKIGMILRSTGACKRGIGSIRQDVNISIRGGARTEIKGFQDLKSIPKVVENEVQRQLSLIKKGEKIEKSVRKAESDFTTSYLRPMPGASRMYPETDIPTIIPVSGKFDAVETLEQKMKRFSKDYSLNADQAKLAVEYEERNPGLEDYFKKYGVEPKIIVDFFTVVPKELKRRYGVEVDAKTVADDIFAKLAAGEITKESIIELLAGYAKNGKLDFSRFRSLSSRDVEQEVKDAVLNNSGAPIGALMGIVMGKLRGQVEGKIVMELLRKHLK